MYLPSNRITKHFSSKNINKQTKTKTEIHIITHVIVINNVISSIE